MNKLFEIDEKKVGKCRDCISCESLHFYRNDWKYCVLKPSKRTDIGFERVKAMQKGCVKFKEIKKGYTPANDKDKLANIVRNSKKDELKCEVEHVFIFDTYFSFVTDGYSLVVRGGGK